MDTGSRLDELRRLESARRTEERRYRITMVLAIAPIGAALALAVLYLTVPATLAERYAYAEIVRPPLVQFMQLAGSVLIAGALAGGALAFAVTEVMGVPGSRGRLILILAIVGGLFGLFIPLVTALVLPVNLFAIDLARLEGGMELVDELLDAIFSTPALVFIYWAQGLYSGVVSGAVMGAVSFASLLSVKTEGRSGVAKLPAAISLGLSSLLLILVLAGPFSLYEGLVKQIAGR